MQPAYFGLKRGEAFVATEQSAREIFPLPMYPQMMMEQIGYVAGKVREFFREYIA
jgi:dTDP-4-amino-4,6-dideoxygalactose transaminase